MALTISPDFVATLTQATAGCQAKFGDRSSPTQKRPSPQAVTAALLHAEKAAKQQRQHYSLDALLGHWRLCFTTGGKVNLQQGVAVGKGFYVPAITPAQISFMAPTSSASMPGDRAEISNQIQLGFLKFQVAGPARYLYQKNILAFDFTQMQLSVLGKTLYQGNFPRRKPADFDNKPIGQLPFFSFFWVTEAAIAARGRGGGLAIWVREP